MFLCLLTVLGEQALAQANQQSTLSTTYPIDIYQPRGLAIADLNGDGHPDLVVAAECLTFSNNQCLGENGAIGVLLGSPDGTLQPMVTYSLPFPSAAEAFSIGVADLNGDGHPDLIVGGYSRYLVVLLGNGDGTFRPAVAYTLYRPAYVYAVADVNGDHFPDLIVGLCLNSTCSQPGVGVRLNNGDGTFGQVITYDSGGQPNSGVGAITVADVNQDGHPDLLVANSCGSVSVCSNGTVGVLLGNGDGTFKAPFSYDSGGGEATDNSSINNSIIVGDVNGDGHRDLLVANSCVQGEVCANATVGVLLGNGNGTFQEAKVYPLAGQVIQGLALANLDGKGVLGLIASSNCGFAVCTLGYIDVALSNLDGTFQPPFQQQTGYPPGFGNQILVADLNGDGNADLLVSNYCGVGGCSLQINSIEVFLGNGSGAFDPPVNYSSGGGESIQSVQALDVNGDGHLDLIVLNECAQYLGQCETGSVAVLLGNGDGTFPQGTYPALSSASEGTVVGQSATFTAAILSDGVAPTGTVTFYDNSSELGTEEIVGGNASYTSSTFQAGTHTITAKYSGDANDSASTGTWQQFVSAAATTTALQSSLSQSYVNQNVTFTAAVVGLYGGTPTGSITFTISGNKPVTVPLSNGEAVFGWTFLHTGQRTVSATYSGDKNYMPGTAVGITQQVNPLSVTQTTLTTSLNPSVVYQPVSYTATVMGQSGSAPTGTVTFAISSNKPVTVPLNNGQATFTWTFLYAGPHTVTASYSGDFANAPSASSSLNQLVDTQATQTTLLASVNPSAVNDAVTFTAVVTGRYGNIPTGSVIFAISENKPVTVPLNNGQAAFTWTFLHSGQRTVTATYSGDVNNQASVSPTLNQTVTP